jgi:hypothetical protein
MLKAGRSQEEMRQHNLGALLRHVHLGAPFPAVLADRMGLNRSTIMALTAELTSAGLVREELPQGHRQGRPAVAGGPAGVQPGVRPITATSWPRTHCTGSATGSASGWRI